MELLVWVKRFLWHRLNSKGEPFVAETHNLMKQYSALNESLAKLFDESGVRRAFTVPYIEGQEMPDHIASVSAAANQAGGLTNNFITTAHKAGGKGWGSAEGETAGHPADKLRNAIIPAKDEHAKAVIDTAQKQINSFKALLGEKNPVVQTAQGQLDLVKHADGAGMNLLDFGTMMIQMMFRPIQAIAKAHSGTKPGGHAPQLRAPVPGQSEEAPAEASGETPAEGSPETPAPAEAAAPAAPAAAAAPATEGQG